MRIAALVLALPLLLSARSGDGTDDTICTSGTTVDLSSTGYTVAFWFMGNGAPGSASNRQPVAIANSDGTPDQVFSYDHTNILYRQAWTHGPVYIPVKLATALSGSTWYHIAFVWDNVAQTTTGYVNGVQDVSVSVLVGPTAEAGKICALSNAGTASFSDDTVAELGIWPTELTAREIASLAAGVSPARIGRPMAVYWPAWGADSPEPDLSGNARNGVLSSAPTSAKHPPLAGLGG